MKRHFSILSLVLLILAFSGCVGKELVDDRYEPDFYRVPRMLADSLETDTVRFLAFGDTQTGWRAEHKFYRPSNWFTWKHLMFPFYQAYLVGNGVVGATNYGRGMPDYGRWSRSFMSEVLYDESRAFDSDFTVFVGDASDDGRRATLWSWFLEDYEPLLREYPFLPSPGNHEYTNDPTGLANYRAVFDYPRFYVQDMPHAALFVMNSNFMIDQHELLNDDEQDRLWEKWFVSSDTSSSPSWLEQQLERRKDRPFKMIAMHHPVITYAWHFKDWVDDSHGRNLEEKRDQLLALLQEYDVQVIFAGHEHVYEHNKLYWSDEEKGDRVLHHVITSGGGTPPREIASRGQIDGRQAYYEDTGYDTELVRQEAAFHFTRGKITADQLVLETFEVEGYGNHETELLDRIVIPPAPAGPLVASDEQPAGSRSAPAE